jgi:hypothetical protein
MFVEVKFEGSEKIYAYRISSKVRMDRGAKYWIVADGRTEYDSPVTVVNKRTNNIWNFKLREITEARLIEGARRWYPKVRKLVFNKSKRTTTLVWEDGHAVTVRCDENDEWDEEKGLALCMVKSLFNGSYYNDWMRSMIEGADRISSKEK